MSLTESRLEADCSDQTRAYLITHGFQDLDDGSAERRWLTSDQAALDIATTAVLFLEAFGADSDDCFVMMGPGDKCEDGQVYRLATTERSSVPLPMDGFEVKIYPSFDRL